jgi:hypothetical protein
VGRPSRLPQGGEVVVGELLAKLFQLLRARRLGGTSANPLDRLTTDLERVRDLGER